MDLPQTLESRRVDVDGCGMHYIASTARAAEQPPVVLIHGVGLSYRYMVPTAELLAPDFRVYIPDQPGFGRSCKPRRVLDIPELADRVAAWMRTVDLREAALLGNSVGCQIIVHLAVRHPELVERAVLQGPTVDPAARTFRQQLARWHRNRRTEGRKEKGPIVVKDYWECGPWRLAKTFWYAMQDRVEDVLPQMRCPTLVVRGERDPIVPQHWAQRVADLLPNGRLVMLGPDVSHTANFEAPEDLVEAVRPFFEAARSRVEHPNV